MRMKMKRWNTAQLFLSETGVHEVEINSDSAKVRCNCAGFSSRSSCKHVRFVRKRMDTNNGIYPTEISSKVSDIDTFIATKNPKLFRQLLINHGKIEAL